MLDTTPEANAVQRSVWAKMGAGRRLELALMMSDEARELSISGVMARCPHLTRRQAQMEVIRRVLGDVMFNEAFGEHLHGS